MNLIIKKSTKIPTEKAQLVYTLKNILWINCVIDEYLGNLSNYVRDQRSQDMTQCVTSEQYARARPLPMGIKSPGFSIRSTT